jgi:D-alanyl-lipoteichoic acid acyltransferase DltB (MBOAT superfamily)
MRNTLIIFLVSGFWHGANWTFIVWGAYHAFLFFPLMIFGLNRKYTDEVAVGMLLPSMKEFIQMLSTFLLAVIGWIIFRAENISQAWNYICGMCSSSLFSINFQVGKKAIVYIIVLIIVEWLQRGKEHGLQGISIGILRYRTARIAFYYVFILLMLLLAGEQGNFIYFQF